MVLMDKKTVGSKEGLGLGIIGLGVMLILMPSTAQKIADLEFVQSEPFSILLGAVYVIALFVILAGAIVTFTNFYDTD
jgi:heme A synthase